MDFLDLIFEPGQQCLCQLSDFGIVRDLKRPIEPGAGFFCILFLDRNEGQIVITDIGQGRITSCTLEGGFGVVIIAQLEVGGSHVIEQLAAAQAVIVGINKI